MSNKKIIISGNTGFIGKSLCRLLAKKNYYFVIDIRLKKKITFTLTVKNEPVFISEISNNEITLCTLLLITQ